VIRRLTAALLALAATLALAACGEKSEPLAGTPRAVPFTLMLDFFPNADHAGIYAAQADGEFRRAGLDVRLQTPSDPSAPLKLLAAGKIDAAISYEPELMLARDKGLDLVSIGALVQRPLTSIIALGREHLTSPAGLEGHTIGTAGIPYQSAYLRTIVEHAGGDPSNLKEVNVGFNLVPAMLSKRVYATLGGFWNYEGIQLQREHKAPKVIRVDEAGVPTYDELVIVVRRDEARGRGELLRRFMQALARGHQSLRKDPAQGVQALLKANPDLDAGLQTEAVRQTLPVFFPTDTTKPFGFQDEAAWAAYGKWMYDNKLVKRLPDPVREKTNEFLPGQGV
jgi:putative hydroxymethylpyrimidine transport system substrate-binding protein